MARVIATITTSVDGYITGPDDREGKGLGEGGERLHHWVMGGPWTYDTDREPGAGMTGEDRAYFDALIGDIGSGIVGRGMFEAAGRWGGTNPFGGGTLYVLTHRTDDPLDPASGFAFVATLDEALARATADAGDKAVAISGGADVIRQALAGGHVDELALSVAPVILGRGKRLFEGLDVDLDLEVIRVWSSPFATHTRYAVRR